LGTFADDLRENRRGRFFLPYQEGWCHGYWSHYVTRCGGEQTLDDRDKQIVDLGYEIGIRCQRIWEDIRLQEQAGPLVAMCSALIAHINSQLVKQEIATARSITPEALIAKVNAQFAKQKKQHAAEARPIPNVQEIDVEHLTDIISDYIFSRSRAGSNLSSSLDLPSNNQTIKTRAVGLKELLSHVAYLKFIFDQLLFLDSIVTIADYLISCRVPTGGVSETYFIQSKLSNVTESLLLSEIEERRTSAWLPLAYGDYSLVRGVRSTRSTGSEEEKVFLDLVPISGAVAKSAFLFMREVVDVEYLFETLESVAGGRDIYRAWDVLHSLSKALLENAIRLKNSSLFSGTSTRADLTKLITQTLGVSLRRARSVIDFFTFQGASRDGIWSRPIVKMDRTFVSLTHIAILETNRIRALHNMIANAKLEALRGKRFQEKCREQLRSSRLKGVVEFVEFTNPIYQLLATSKQETDFLLRLGDILLICEAKSTSHIATPREFYHGFNALKAGADQLKKRLQTLIACRSQVENWLFGKAGVSLNFSPVIVTNTDFFQGLSIEGVRVVSLATLIGYLRHEVKLPCADTAYYDKKGLEMLFSHSIGGQELKESSEARKGSVGFGLYGQIIEFDYFALPAEEVYLSISDPKVWRP
jgi:hypothetical protein